MNDFLFEQLAAARAESAERFDMLVNCHFLVGYYGSQAERSGNADLAAFVRDLSAVLDGTWTQPEVPR